MRGHDTGRTHVFDSETDLFKHNLVGGYGSQLARFARLRSLVPYYWSLGQRTRTLLTVCCINVLLHAYYGQFDGGTWFDGVGEDLCSTVNCTSLGLS